MSAEEMVGGCLGYEQCRRRTIRTHLCDRRLSNVWYVEYSVGCKKKATKRAKKREMPMVHMQQSGNKAKVN